MLKNTCFGDTYRSNNTIKKCMDNKFKTAVNFGDEGEQYN